MQLNSDLIVNTICLQTKLVLMLALATYGTLAEFTIIYSYTVPQEFASDCTRRISAQPVFRAPFKIDRSPKNN